MRLITINGSAVQSGRTRLALQKVAEAARATDPELTVDAVDLARDRVGIADARAPEECDDDTAAVLSRISCGDCFVIGTPIYRGTYTGALKNLLDRVPLEALEHKPVALLATGASAHHYLAIDTALRPVLAWFNAFLLPGSVYVGGADYRDGKLVNPTVEEHLAMLGTGLVAITRRLGPDCAGPPCLTRQMWG